MRKVGLANCGDVRSTGSAALNRKQHAMIILRARIFSREQVSVVLSLHWILQDRPAALVRVSGRGARSGGLQDIALCRADPVHRSSGEIDSPIDVTSHPRVECLVSQIACG